MRIRSAEPDRVRERQETRERQLRSLRTRRLTTIQKDPRVQAEVRRGWEYLDRLEARRCLMTRAQVAASLGLTYEGVRLIELRALAKVRAAIGITEAA